MRFLQPRRRSAVPRRRSAVPRRPGSPTILMILLFLCVFYLILPTSVSGQTTQSFTHYGISDGLSHSRIYALLQDSRGYIWVGTSNGLNRFDGREFIEFRHREGDESSLPDDFVTSLIQDAAGDIWVGTDGGGIGRLDPERGSFTRYHSQASQPSLRISDDSVWGLLADSRGFI